MAGSASGTNASHRGGVSAHTRAFLREQAHDNAYLWGDNHPYAIEAVRTTHRRADRVQRLVRTETPYHQRLPATAPVYLIAMRGHFCWKATIATKAGCRPVALIQLSEPGKREYYVGTVAKHYPNLRALGKPIRLDVQKR